MGTWELDLDRDLGLSGVANYGYDNVNLEDEVIVPDQVVAVVNSTRYLNGFMGLGVKVSNFQKNATDFNKPTFLTTLAENQTRVPSRSYGYTAGAFYRLKGVPASLTLGGFDANRFEVTESLDTPFSLSPDGAPVVAINQITVTANPSSTSTSRPNWSSSPLNLWQGDADFFTIDSSTPFLWLPEKICDQFADALDLQYNDTLQLYTFGRNTSQHNTLVAWNLTFTFQIADLLESTKSLNITLPYGAFDLQLTYPYPGLNLPPGSPGLNYFPLRRAANRTQYTIGRAFLQESYLIVDYDRHNFSINQAKFAPDAISNVNIVSITKPRNTTRAANGVTPSSGHISKGAIAGIIIGVAIGIVAVAALVFYLRRRRRQSRKGAYEQTLSDDTKAELDCPAHPTGEAPPNVWVDHKFPPTEVSAEQRTELPGNSPAELPGSAPAELEGSEVAPMKDGREISPHRVWRRKLGSRIPPSWPVRNDQRHWSSSSETTTARTPTSHLADSEPSPVTPRAYSPARNGRGGHHSPNDVSPQSSQATTPLFSPFMPSPLAPAFPRGDAECHRCERDDT